MSSKCKSESHRFMNENDAQTNEEKMYRKKERWNLKEKW